MVANIRGSYTFYMAAQAAFQRVTIDEYLAGELLAETKHELYDGLVYAMSGASPAHVLLTSTLARMAGNAFRGKTCRFLGIDAKVIVSEVGSSFYPDGVVACPPHWINGQSGAIDNPTVIFEVLSSSTENYDRSRKFDAYARLSSLQEYVLIYTRARRVDVLSRGNDWTIREYLEGSAIMGSVGLELSLDELYEDVTFDQEENPEDPR